MRLLNFILYMCCKYCFDVLPYIYPLFCNGPPEDDHVLVGFSSWTKKQNKRRDRTKAVVYYVFTFPRNLQHGVRGKRKII